MIVLMYFLTRTPCRIVTTSVDANQLQAVLWGEINRFIQTSSIPLEHTKGGPLVVNHMMIRKINQKTKEVDGLSYIIGRVAAQGEGMLGHHIAKTGDGVPRTLFLADEASGVDDVSYERASTWAHRVLVIGNCYSNPAGANFFQKGVKQGDIPATDYGEK